MTDHLAEMRDKIARLRALDAEAELERRWDEDDDYAERYNESRLALYDPVTSLDGVPAGLAGFYALTDGARFGDVDIRAYRDVRPQVAVDYLGEPVDDGDRLQIGDLPQDMLMWDRKTEHVIVYFDLYFKYRWDSGILVEVADMAEFVNTVALGDRYREIRGPLDKQSSPWWEEDPWYRYLRETGMATA
ncbi:hypothetical protein LX16_4115 [Stackebrandtia albiflava]|uniref:SUKH-4 immunity protein of toxin-antitoxin system n=1 Tax=Stackebrandtia albiflava TaxID=406432 RepID=A0A562UYL2_9ACTN|nr:hypothetical protein [Stackebrandtia albiflava]TWJ10695.1 hypothetical protein LX16_4115 [Stackebrandtia albiflava]